MVFRAFFLVCLSEKYATRYWFLEEFILSGYQKVRPLVAVRLLSWRPMGYWESVLTAVLVELASCAAISSLSSDCAQMLAMEHVFLTLPDWALRMLMVLSVKAILYSTNLPCFASKWQGRLY